MTFLAPEADLGFKDAARYDQYRPSYPSEAVDKLLSNLNVADQQNARIIEIGAGTGKFTGLLADRKERFEIVAVEPHKEMREGLEKKNLRGVRVPPGDAANIPAEKGWGDAVIAAQVDNAPLSWKLTTKWEEKLNKLIWGLDDGKPRFRHEKWKNVFEKQLDTTPLQTIRDTLTHHLPVFSLPLGEEDLTWTVWLSEEALWDRFSTLSQIAILEGAELESAKDIMAEALKGDDVERNERDEVAVHGRTHLAWTSRV
ncbi:MAG: hypothetical protein M1818_001074 [Claussenomyces sp. TS43310]|nr:MAG: hypothetical protein M1818_001074 [Claussenomyces sp. TS43310]